MEANIEFFFKQNQLTKHGQLWFFVKKFLFILTIYFLAKFIRGVYMCWNLVTPFTCKCFHQNLLPMRTNKKLMIAWLGQKWHPKFLKDNLNSIIKRVGKIWYNIEILNVKLFDFMFLSSRVISNVLGSKNCLFEMANCWWKRQ